MKKISQGLFLLNLHSLRTTHSSGMTLWMKQWKAAWCQGCQHFVTTTFYPLLQLKICFSSATTFLCSGTINSMVHSFRSKLWLTYLPASGLLLRLPFVSDVWGSTSEIRWSGAWARESKHFLEYFSIWKKIFPFKIWYAIVHICY